MNSKLVGLKFGNQKVAGAFCDLHPIIDGPIIDDAELIIKLRSPSNRNFLKPFSSSVDAQLSYLEEYLERYRSGGEIYYRILEEQTYRQVTYDVSAGDALIFFHNTIHSAPEHSNDFYRAAMSIRYLMDGSALTEECINPTPPYPALGWTVVEGGRIPESYFPREDLV